MSIDMKINSLLYYLLFSKMLLYEYDEIQKKISEWKVLTRKDMISGWDDVVIFRCETSYGTHGTSIETIYKIKWIWSLYKYKYEKKLFGLWKSENNYKISDEDAKKIEKLIINEMKKLKWLWKLERYSDERYTLDGTLTNIYISDWKQWVIFKYSTDNDINWKNMKILLNIQNKIEKILKKIEKESKWRELWMNH